MAKILCAKSGIQFECDHFPISFTSGELHHPIFDAPLKRLWKYFPKWQNEELTEIDSYLYFLALLNVTELIEWRTAVLRERNTAKIIAENMEPLYSLLNKITVIRHPRFVLPRFVISHDTRTLSNVKHWLAVWEDQYADFCNGLKDQDIRSKLQKREAALERLIRNPAIKPERYAHLLAHWASIAGQFPEFSLSVRGSLISCSEYWQDIIVKCHSHVDIIQIDKKDLQELLEHCEEHIELGSIFSYQLFTTLREGIEAIDGFFGIGTTQFAILSDDSNVEQSNLSLLINDAPSAAPRRIDYATEFQFLKAKMKWSLAVSQSQSQSQSSQNVEGI